MSASATLPPRRTTMSSFISFLERYDLSSLGKDIVNPPAIPLGIIEIWWTGSWVGQKYVAIACPASWYAVNFFSASLITRDFFSAPTTTLIVASSTSVIVIALRSFLAARSAASLRRFSRSAPVKPAVDFAIVLRTTSGARGLPFAWTLSISSRPFISGLPTITCLSKRPGRIRAGSRISGRFVAAIIITPSLAPKPSISTRSWLSVCSRSSCPPPRPAPRWRPTASISSINMIQGLFFLACSKRSRTLDAPTPTNISTKSEPEIEKNWTPASPATALARSVLPVPGGPTSKTPFGILAPSSLYFLGSLRNSTISRSSSFSSSAPATSAKVVLRFSSEMLLILAFPKPIVLPSPPIPLDSFRIKYIQNTTNAPNNIIFGNKSINQEFSDALIWSYFIGSSGCFSLYWSTYGLIWSRKVVILAAVALTTVPLSSLSLSSIAPVPKSTVYSLTFISLK